ARRRRAGLRCRTGSLGRPTGGVIARWEGAWVCNQGAGVSSPLSPPCLGRPACKRGKNGGRGCLSTPVVRLGALTSHFGVARPVRRRTGTSAQQAAVRLRDRRSLRLSVLQIVQVSGKDQVSGQLDGLRRSLSGVG